MATPNTGNMAVSIDNSINQNGGGANPGSLKITNTANPTLEGLTFVPKGSAVVAGDVLTAIDANTYSWATPAP